MRRTDGDTGTDNKLGWGRLGRFSILCTVQRDSNVDVRRLACVGPWKGDG